MKYLSLLAIIAIMVSLSFCTGQEQEKEKEVASSLQYAGLHDSVNYVGSNQCRLCHQDKFNSFMETGMGKSFDHATREKSIAEFKEHTVIYDKHSDFYYHPFWKDDTMKILEFRLHNKDTVYKRVQTVDYVIGSGQHTNSHISNVNGYLYQMPMTFYSQKKEWHLPPGFEDGFNTRFSRKIGLECMSCHNELPEFVKGSENKFSAVPNGISCERCHGPGEIHVKEKSLNINVDTSKYIDYSVVNPGKLSIDLQFDVCQRCHLQGNTILKDGKSFFDFKPGMRLSEVMTVFLPKYKGAEDEFIMASHADRLKMSPCFIKSYKEGNSGDLRPYKNAMTCVTCHNPHVSVTKTKANTFISTCKSCHNDGKDCTEDMKARNLVADNCITCHMPKNNTLDIPHVTTTDHFIRKPVNSSEKKKVKEFLGLYAINESSPSGKIRARAYLNQYEKFDQDKSFLDSASFYLSDKSVNEIEKNLRELVQLNFAKQAYNKVTSYVNSIGRQKVLKNILVRQTWDNQDAWTLYRIGESFYNVNDVNSAYIFYEQAARLAPYNSEFVNKKGTMLVALGKNEQAEEIMRRIIKEDPSFVPAYSNLGYLCMLKGSVTEAKKLYDKALSLDPDYESALLNMAGYHLFNRNEMEAKKVLVHLLKKHPGNVQAKNIMNQIR